MDDLIQALISVTKLLLHNPDIVLSLSGLMVSQPLSQSVGRRFESQRKCWDFSSLKNKAISALIYISRLQSMRLIFVTTMARCF